VTFAVSDSGGSGDAGGSIGRIATSVSAGGTTGATACWTAGAGDGRCANTMETMSAAEPTTANKIALDSSMGRMLTPGSTTPS